MNTNHRTEEESTIDSKRSESVQVAPIKTGWTLKCDSLIVDCGWYDERRACGAQRAVCMALRPYLLDPGTGMCDLLGLEACKIRRRVVEQEAEIDKKLLIRGPLRSV